MKTLLIDGNNALWRVAKSLPGLNSPLGEPIEVVYGFLKLLRTVVDKFEPNKVIVCWDQGKPAYRLSIYPDYKGNREKKRMEFTRAERVERDSVLYQMRVIKTILPYLGVRQVAYDDTEADDLLATASRLDRLGLRILVSGDRDMLQLVQCNVRVWMPLKKLLYTRKNFEERTGMTMDQWRDYRILTGEPQGDNIPRAAKGFGEKAAEEIVKKWRVSTILTDSKVRNQIRKMGKKYSLLLSEQAQKQILLNAKLIEIHTSVDNEMKLRRVIATELATKRKLNPQELRKIFTKHAFASLLLDFAIWILPFKELD